ncbi:MAG TPA: hypothetical protein VK186_00675 [Candidatus Deferrimicrobium sp.]|nr:hypothetical protein [Candidatus Deferrimicrobium sp.]
MANRDEFSQNTKRILAERAGQRCSNPKCVRSTSGPSDYKTNESTLMGKAAHITAAAEGGPRYDPSLTSEQRKSQDNGIWLCAECADRVDKPENEDRYPVELLRNWKKVNESATGTDFATNQDRTYYPIRKLKLVDFAGVRGEVEINFAALTIFHGTSKLNHTIGEILKVFSNRELFECTRQTIRKTLPTLGKIKLTLSDEKEIIICTEIDKAMLSIGDNQLPVFSPFINIISTRSNLSQAVFGSLLSDENSNILGRLSNFFGVSINELKNSIKGTPTDNSLFGYFYKIVNDSELYIKVSDSNDFFSFEMLSGGEQNRFALDMAIRLAKYSSKVKPTVLTIDQNHLISLDNEGWALFFERIEREKMPFQVVVDLCYQPSDGNLSHAMCYEATGIDMAVTSFKQLSWDVFKGNRGH